MSLRYLSFTLLCILSTSFFVGTLGKCPSRGMVYPCTCYMNVLKCYDITDQSDLDGVFRRLGNNRLDFFYLVNSQVDHLNSSILKSNGFREIYVLNSVLNNVFDDFPPSQNQLTHVEINNVTLRKQFHTEYLQRVKKLKEYYVERTIVPQFAENFNKYLTDKIERVRLYETKTESIDHGFSDKFLLEYISVEDNSLTSINRASFPNPANKLEELSLRGNQIESLGDDQFTEMSALRFLNLGNNKIIHITEEVFGEIYDQLDVLDLSGNPIVCDCSIHWITEKNNKEKVKGKCAAPPNVAGKPIMNLKPSDFQSCTKNTTD